MTVLGAAPGSSLYDPKTGQISYRWKEQLTPGRHRAIVWGDAPNGQRYASVWTFYTSEAEKARYQQLRKQLVGLPLHHTDATRPPQ